MALRGSMDITQLKPCAAQTQAGMKNQGSRKNGTTHFRLVLRARLWQDPSTSSLWGPPPRGPWWSLPPASCGFVPPPHVLPQGWSAWPTQDGKRDGTWRHAYTPYSMSCSRPSLFQGEEHVTYFSPPIQLMLIFQSTFKSPQTFPDTTPDSNLFPSMTSYCLRIITTHSHMKVFWQLP